MGFNAIAYVAAAVGTALVANQQDASRKAANAQKDAQAAATVQAAQQANLADQANNKANAKQPDIAALLASNMNKQGGAGSTMLTGSSGVDPSTLLLGKSTLLGS